MFEFYNIFFKMGYLTKDDVREATEWGVITIEEYERIVGEAYAA